MSINNTPFERLIDAVARTAMDICMKGWAERNAGNISIRLKPEEIHPDFSTTGNSTALNSPAPFLAGEHILITASGSHMRNVPVHPSDYLGIIRIDELGESYCRVWGFGQGVGPTSELSSHIMAHSARKEASDNIDRVVIHTHALNILALTNAEQFNSSSLTRLLWETHSECIVVFPEGIEILQWHVPGSDELGKATAEAFRRRRMAVWPLHGIIAAGPDLDSVFGLIDTADKAAAIHIASSFRGAPKNNLTIDQLQRIADSFGLRPDPDAMKL